MPSLTRWFVKLSLIYLAVALLVGMVITARPVLNLPAGLVTLTPVYFHLLMVGWVTQLIFGVAYWMFPKYSQERPRGSKVLAWAAFGLLNTGLILRAVAEPIHALQPHKIWGWLLTLSALLQWLAGLGFAANLWPRARER